MATRPRRSPVSSDKRFRKIHGGGDHGTAERWQHSGRVIEVTDRAGILAVRAPKEHILDVLALRRLLDAVQIETGLRFKADYHAASLAAHVTGSYTGMSNARDFFHGEYERSDAQEAAYRRWKNAVIATVCHDAAPQTKSIVLLQEGLRQLAVWCGMR